MPKTTNHSAETLAEIRTLLGIDAHDINKAATILGALNHTLRQKILLLIAKEGEITVTELYIRLQIEQPTVSHHLTLLRKAGIVKTRRGGKFIYYSVNLKVLDCIHIYTQQLIS